MQKIYISPSFLSANFLNLQKDIEMINNSQADFFHLDVMDGVFVPNISFGFPIISQIKTLAQKPLDVHIMITQPSRYIEKFAEVGTSILTLHYEAEKHLHRAVNHIKSCGMMAGVSLNPHTPVAVLEDIIGDVDLVLLMSVNPGFGGQKFIENTYKKVIQLRQLVGNAKSKALIEVDGGVDLNNCKKLVECGVDILVAGSSIFNAPNPWQVIEKMKNIFDVSPNV